MAKNTITVSRVLIDNSGMVVWLRIGQFSSSCAMNVEWFPFDEQTCDMTFTSLDSDDDLILKTISKEKKKETAKRKKREIEELVERQKRDDEENDEDDDYYEIYEDYEDSDEDEKQNNRTDEEDMEDGEWKIVGKLNIRTCFHNNQCQT